jgi:hypothetical protein
MHVKASDSVPESRPKDWLLLIHQLPPKQAYFRVKIWRKLQGLGVITLKNSVYALPAGNHAREDFRKILKEIERHGGDGLLCESAFIAGMRDDQVRGLFNTARDEDYAAVTRELRQLSQSLKRLKKQQNTTPPALIKFRQRLADIGRIDYFAAPGRTAAESLLAELEHSAITTAGKIGSKRSVLSAKDVTGKIWVTRRDIHVDRIACAWLIKRFVDPAGTLKFVPGNDYEPLPGELRYDMRDGEFTHEGEDCSFETILKRTGAANPALKAIGEIIHDIDLKDGKFGRPETAGIAHVIAGICRTQGDDEARLARGRELLDDTYEQFRRRAGRKA